MAGILVHIELAGESPHPFSLESLKTARRIASDLGATLYAVLPCDAPPLYDENDIIALLSRSGADKVILMTHPSLGSPPRFFGHGSALLDACRQFRPSLLFVPETLGGRDIAPAVASSLGAVYMIRPEFYQSPSGEWKAAESNLEGTRRREVTLNDVDRPIVALFRRGENDTFPEITDEAEVVVLSPGSLERMVDVEAPSSEEMPGLVPSSPVLLVAGSLLEKDETESLRRVALQKRIDMGVTWEAYKKGLGEVFEVVGAGAETRAAETLICFGLENHRKDLLQRRKGFVGVVVQNKNKGALFKIATKGLAGDARRSAIRFEEFLQGNENPEGWGEKIEKSEDRNADSDSGCKTSNVPDTTLFRTADRPVMVLVSPRSLKGGEIAEESFDVFPLSCAAKIHSSNGIPVIVVCCGPKEIEKDFSSILSKWRFRGVRVWDDKLADAGYRAYERVLEAVAGLFNPCLVLAGDRSSVWGHGVLGPATARKLGWPHITGAFGVSLVEEQGRARAIVEKLAGRIFSTWSFELPGVITLSGIMEEKNDSPDEADENRGELETLTMEDIGITDADLGPLCRLEGELKDVEQGECEIYESEEILFSDVLKLVDGG